MDATFPSGIFSTLVSQSVRLSLDVFDVFESAFEERAPGGHAFLQTVGLFV